MGRRVEAQRRWLVLDRSVLARAASPTVGLAGGSQTAVAVVRQLEPALVVEKRQQVPVGGMRESRKEGNWVPPEVRTPGR